MFSELTNDIATVEDRQELELATKEVIIHLGQPNADLHALVSRYLPVYFYRKLNMDLISQDPHTKLSKLLQELNQMEIAEVTIAIPATVDIVSLILNWLRRNIDKNIILSIKTDPLIGGGLMLTYKGKYVDLSLSQKIRTTANNNEKFI